MYLHSFPSVAEIKKNLKLKCIFLHRHCNSTAPPVSGTKRPKNLCCPTPGIRVM